MQRRRALQCVPVIVLIAGCSTLIGQRDSGPGGDRNRIDYVLKGKISGPTVRDGSGPPKEDLGFAPSPT